MSIKSLAKGCFNAVFGKDADVAVYGYVNSKISSMKSDRSHARYLAQRKHDAELAYLTDKEKYIALNKRPEFNYSDEMEYACLYDRYDSAGVGGYYLWQDLWAARKIHDLSPEYHYDIASRVDGFITHLASFRENTVLIDIRPLPFNIPNVSFLQEDATLLSSIPDNSIESLSALCALEHFGLGRYGDPVDPEACFTAFKSIQRVMKPGGMLYISLPVGKSHVCFNAGRVFKASSVVSCFNEMELVEFTTIYKDNEVEYNSPIDKYDNDDSYPTCICGTVGLFQFRKL